MVLNKGLPPGRVSYLNRMPAYEQFLSQEVTARNYTMCFWFWLDIATIGDD
jgi:hypothetical protein